MANENPQIYYENQENHGDYAYETLENLVNNYEQNFTGDNTLLGHTPRRQVLFWMKKGIQQFTFNALKEVKAVELELTDNLDIILPPDYVEYVRISWLDVNTGELRPMSENKKLTLATSYLQDNDANILFDDEGEILEGTTATELINSTIPDNVKSYSFCSRDNWDLDTSINGNGNFNIDKRVGRIHFSSDNASRIIVLEYISDGLEYTDEENIKVSKLAEMALYSWCSWNLLNNKIGVPDYEKRRAKKDYDTAYRNSKIKLMGIKMHEIAQAIKKANSWFK
jgi:hypothetical protein